METKYFFPFDQQLCLGFYGKGHDETPKLGFCQLARVTTTTSLHLRKNAGTFFAFLKSFVGNFFKDGEQHNATCGIMVHC